VFLSVLICTMIFSPIFMVKVYLELFWKDCRQYMTRQTSL